MEPEELFDLSLRAASETLGSEVPLAWCRLLRTATLQLLDRRTTDVFTVSAALAAAAERTAPDRPQHIAEAMGAIVVAQLQFPRRLRAGGRTRGVQSQARRSSRGEAAIRARGTAAPGS